MSDFSLSAFFRQFLTSFQTFLYSCCCFWSGCCNSSESLVPSLLPVTLGLLLISAFSI